MGPDWECKCIDLTLIENQFFKRESRMRQVRNEDIELLIFDLGGVILNIDYRSTQKAFTELGVMDVESLYSQASQSNLFDELEKGHISPKEFRSRLRTIIGGSMSDAEIDDAWNALLLDLPIERLEFISSLKMSRKICLLSNTNEIHIQCFEKELLNTGLIEKFKNCFDEIYYSSRVGMRKPDREVFQYVLGEFDVKAENCLFIDDSEQHIVSAEKLGINVLLLKKGREISDVLAYLIS